MEIHCGKCNKMLDTALCKECIAEIVQDEASMMMEKVSAMERRLEAAEGEIVRLQQKWLDRK
ncbi:hypothetical protein KJ765_02670 [Candidatus Micrarchaeota archaeon]|nr:hypothetical protein [Candidatus Micrarchaeota archaeon]